MKICAICYQPIYCFYYKSSCECCIYYHIECINQWYKNNRSCILCRKKDTNSNQFINKHRNKALQVLILLMSCLIIILILIFNID